MPESKRRKKADRGSEAPKSARGLTGSDALNFKELDQDDETLPAWYRFTMIGLLLLGLLWIIVWYISAGAWPIAAAGGWNIIIGFGVAGTGFMMLMRWK